MSGEEQNRGPFIGTYLGVKFYPQDPRPEEIYIEDIAHSLSQQCRYTGHTKHFYSVAEHSILLASYALNKLRDADLAKWALMHDASEAYVTDVPRPLKPLFKGYKEAEEAVQKAIAARFDLDWPIPKTIHEIDSRMLFDEAPRLMALPVSEWSFQLEPLGLELRLMSPSYAEETFILWAEGLNMVRVDSGN